MSDRMYVSHENRSSHRSTMQATLEASIDIKDNEDVNNVMVDEEIESYIEEEIKSMRQKAGDRGATERRRRKRKLKFWRKKRRMMTCFHITCAS